MRVCGPREPRDESIPGVRNGGVRRQRRVGRARAERAYEDV